jgi:hypothetical protein
MASNCPNYVDLCYANGLLREREQPFHRLRTNQRPSAHAASFG